MDYPEYSHWDRGDWCWEFAQHINSNDDYCLTMPDECEGLEHPHVIIEFEGHNGLRGMLDGRACTVLAILRQFA